MGQRLLARGPDAGPGRGSVGVPAGRRQVQRVCFFSPWVCQRVSCARRNSIVLEIADPLLRVHCGWARWGLRVASTRGGWDGVGNGGGWGRGREAWGEGIRWPGLARVAAGRGLTRCVYGSTCGGFDLPGRGLLARGPDAAPRRGLANQVHFGESSGSLDPFCIFGAPYSTCVFARALVRSTDFAIFGTPYSTFRGRASRAVRKSN